MTIGEALATLTGRFTTAGLDVPAFDAKELLCHLLKVSPARLSVMVDDSLTETQAQALENDAVRRLQGYPLQYLIGRWGFYKGEFQVGEGVLIPRPDTEILVETALSLLSTKENPVVADLCAGSGCIGISIAMERPDANVIAVELSDKAIPYLKQNILANGTPNVTLLCADVLSCPDLPACDLIVSNPPYIPQHELATLSQEVRHEPVMALDGGADGLLFYRAIAKGYYDKLKLGGHLAFEVGYDQSEAVGKILLENGYRNVTAKLDYANIQRVVYAEK